MPDFAPWLAKRSKTDPPTKALQDFASANADKWPASSNSISDYHRMVSATASSGTRDELLTALGRLYERWFEQERQGFLKQVAAHGGLVSLLIGGLIIAAGLAYGIFFNESFFDLMAPADHARGLITFLFSFATIGILVLVAVGLARIERRLASDDDFSCAFYGNLFRPKGKAAGDPPFDASDVADEWERELLELWWREAAGTDLAVHEPDGRTKLSTPNVVQRALSGLSQSSFFSGLAERALIFDLKQVRRYINESEIRHAARANIERAVGPDTTVIIAHSLGSVVAYETLCAHPEWPVHTLVTIGSPLGIANLIFDKLYSTNIVCACSVLGISAVPSRGM
jgi:hypothetical protein